MVKATAKKGEEEQQQRQRQKPQPRSIIVEAIKPMKMDIEAKGGQDTTSRPIRIRRPPQCFDICLKYTIIFTDIYFIYTFNSILFCKVFVEL